MAAVPRLKPYAGPALLSYGFRPFFLLGSIWAGLEILAWLPILHGRLSLASSFSPRDWHVHELIFGYVPAIVAGFLLTAIPNWTGRLPLQGGPLGGLVLAWLSGRYAVTFSAEIGWIGAMTVDSIFLWLMMAAVAREIVADAARKRQPFCCVEVVERRPRTVEPFALELDDPVVVLELGIGRIAPFL